MEILLQTEEALVASFSKTFFGISIYQYLLALIFILAGFVLRRVTENLLERLSRATSRTRFRYDDILIETVRRPLPMACLIFGIFLAINVLPVPTEPVDVRYFMHALFRSVTVLFVVWVVSRLVDGLCEQWLETVRAKKRPFDAQLVPIVRKSGKVFLWIVGGILFLQNMGYSVGSLLAGFGLGGAAVALAAKDSLSNLFGSIVIFFDRPFRVGDWIEMDGWEGTIEEIGLRTTRVRTFANSLMTVPNSKFTTMSINNWSRMQKRRIKMTVGLTYDANAEQVEAAVERIRQIIRDDPNIRDDFFLVNFDAFGPSSLDIFIYCFTKTTIWGKFLDAKQGFMLSIMRELNKMGLELAFPTRTVHLVGSVGGEGREVPQRPG